MLLYIITVIIIVFFAGNVLLFLWHLSYANLFQSFMGNLFYYLFLYYYITFKYINLLRKYYILSLLEAFSNIC